MAENSVAQIKVNAVTNHDGARAMVTAMMGTNTVRVDSANVLDLAVGDTEITVTVTAEDGTMMTYMITVTKPAATTDPLLDRFDGDNDMGINRAEIDMAIDRFLGLTTEGDDLSRADIDHLIDLFLGLA